jgi:tetratricopeptide (TPR) repeat protein
MTIARESIRDSDIRFYEARIARDRYGARDRAALGALYLARARAQGSEADLQRAESMARESWHTRHKRNPDALSILIGSLVAQHRFNEAREIGLELLAADATPVVRATLAEIDLELGRYAEADSLFAGLSVVQTQPAIAPRYARWLEVNGRSGEARELLQRTRVSIAASFRVPVDQLAWLDLRIGDLAFRNGRGDLAEAAYQRGLTLLPGDPRLLTALAQLRGAERRWAEAITLGETALATRFDPATLGLLSHAYLASGDSAKAAEYARATQVAVSQAPGAFHRAWALSLLDQGEQVDTLLHRARAELRTRKDVYGYDLMAWALYRSGRPAEALVLADSALMRGTRDATLHFHAGRIAEALGDTARATSEYATARAISPLALALVAEGRP